MALAFPDALAVGDRRALESACLRAFEEQAGHLTVGVEEELMLLDPASLTLAPVCAELLLGAGDDERFSEELPAAQIEIITPACATADGIAPALRAARADLRSLAGERVRLAGSGTHPFAAVEGEVSPGPRYRAIAEEYQWGARRGLAWGLHVHVAVTGAARALAVHDALRSYLPEIAALAGNSPFHGGRDTGLHAVRPKLAEGFPRQGIPPAWTSWEGFADFVGWGAGAGAFTADGRQLWWEVRLNPRFGTIEVRVCDQPATARESAALAAVIQALASKLCDDYDAGMLPEPVARERIEENRWRALRHGLDGTLLDYESGDARSTRERVGRLLTELEPHARQLDSGRSLAAAWKMLRQTGSERQREVAAAAGGSLRPVVADLADRLDAELRGTRD